MKKVLFIISVFLSGFSYGQVVGLNGNTPVNRGIGVWDGTGDSLTAQESGKRWTMAHKYDVYGVNARGNHWYGSLAGSSATVSTEGLIALGHNAARLINTGGYGIYMGWQSGYNLPSASYGNIYIGGYRPGFNQTAGSRSLILGYLLDLPSLTADNQMNIMAAIFGLGVGEVTGQLVSTGKIGIFKAVPTEALDLVGNFRFSGAIMPNNTAGTSGQVLTSAGAGLVPTWTTPSSAGITQLTGDVTAGPGSGSQVATLATVNSNIGSFTAANITVNAKGLITAAASGQTQGTYVPTITGVANLAASSVPNFNWERIGDQFEIWGEVTLDPTTTATLTVVGISLPIATSLTNTYELSGTASDDLGTSVRVAGDGTNDRAEMRFTPTDVTNRVFSVHFKFKWIAP